MKYKVLIVADVQGWAYDTRMQALHRHAPEDFIVMRSYHSSPAPGAPLIKDLNCRDFDLVFSLDYQSPLDGKVRKEDPSTAFVCSHNRCSKSMLERWQNTYKQVETLPNAFIICNNEDVFNVRGRLRRTCCISNGVDLEKWGIDIPMRDRPRKVIWYGGANQTKGKSYQDVLVPLEKMLTSHGFSHHFRPFYSPRDPDVISGKVQASPPLQKWAWPQSKMREWYNSAFVTIIASAHEGTPAACLEGPACGCVHVTTPVGNVLEFGRDRENLVFIDRNPESALKGILYAWEHRQRLSAAGHETIRGWSYGEPGNRAAYFFQLFRRLIRDGADSVESFSYSEISQDEI